MVCCTTRINNFRILHEYDSLLLTTIVDHAYVNFRFQTSAIILIIAPHMNIPRPCHVHDGVWLSQCSEYPYE